MSVASRANAGIFAVPANEVVVAFAERVGPLFVEEALQAAGGAAWSHPALTGRGRSIAIPPRPWSLQGVRRSPQHPTCSWDVSRNSTKQR